MRPVSVSIKAKDGNRDLVKTYIVAVNGWLEEALGLDSLDALSLSPGPTEMTKTIAPGAEHLIRNYEESLILGLLWKRHIGWTNVAEPNVSSFYNKSSEGLTFRIDRETAMSMLLMQILYAAYSKEGRYSHNNSATPKAVLV